MSKYKYEKEFMFSNRRLDEVELFLQNQEHPLDLLAIRDNNKNTVIHHTAYHNQTKVLELYLKYYRKNLENQKRNLVQIKLQTRYLLDQPNSQGYTAVHYATFRGNMAVLKVLQKYEANFQLTNHLKMGVLHLAAQGDKLGSFLFMHNKKLNLNSIDSKLSTPMHWASFAGSQKIVEYLLAQKDVEINPVDVEGFTPLHLATNYGNSKIVKKLLIAGADRQLTTNKGQTALQIAQQKQFQGIRRMLDENYTLSDRLKLICNAKVMYKPQKKSFLAVLVFLIISVIAAIMSLWLLEFNNLWIEIAQGCVYFLAIVIYLSLVLKGKKVETQVQNYALYAQNKRQYHLCLICVKQMGFRQHHCHICKACIPQYDHHCTWINNCVGKHNLFRFNLFLYLTFLSLAWLAFLAVSFFVCLVTDSYESFLFVVRPWFQQDGKPILLVVSILVFLVFLTFGLPLLFLILVQTKNLLLGKTTYERFSKTHQSLLTRQGSLLNLNKQKNQPSVPSLRNCLNMYYEYQSEGQQRKLSNSTTSSANRIAQ